jgi:hypothetical protein
MLYDLMSEKQFTEVPYGDDYRRMIARMTPEELLSIKNTLNEMIDGTDIQTSSWMPGSNWMGTPFEPIYTKAANKNFDLAAKCFGLIVWEVVMERPEKWRSGRFEKNGQPLSGRTYFISRD